MFIVYLTRSQIYIGDIFEYEIQEKKKLLKFHSSIYNPPQNKTSVLYIIICSDLNRRKYNVKKINKNNSGNKWQFDILLADLK